jgi:hypothetical protein
MINFKFDVAFSFLAADQARAVAISARLTGRLRTFVYSEQQKELAGADGVDAFTRVFRTEARTVVVLHRTRWGQTKWTRVEENAIKSRGFESTDGFDFLIMAPLDSSNVLPAWYPITRLYLDLGQYGVEGAAAVIEDRVRRAGGLPHELTPEDAVAQLNSERTIEGKRQALLAEHGVVWAHEEANRIVARLEEVAASSSGTLTLRRFPPEFISVLRGGTFSVRVEWHNSYHNSLDHSGLAIVLYDDSASSRALRQRIFHFDLTADGDRQWQEERGRAFTTEAIVGEAVSMVTEQMRKGGSRRRR